jgi:hypothetical protein
LLNSLVDRAACDPDTGGVMSEAIDEHRRYRGTPHAAILGAIVVRVSTIDQLLRLRVDGQTGVALVADTGMERLPGAVAALRAAGVTLLRIEAPVAKRGEDPVPGILRLTKLAAPFASLPVHAEIPLSGGLIDALDEIVTSRERTDVRLAATFRLGGLAAELFPSPPVLAGVLCACRDRGVRFTVSGGLQRAMRHNDPETGFTHHGVLNVLAACLTAATGAAGGAVADRLMTTDPVPLVELVRAGRDLPRPLLCSYTTARVEDFIADLVTLNVLSRPPGDDAPVVPSSGRR